MGKSWLACALGHQACRDNRSVLYQRIPKLFTDLALAGRYARLMRALGGVQLLILDDWGLAPLDAAATIFSKSSKPAMAAAPSSSPANSYAVHSVRAVMPSIL